MKATLLFVTVFIACISLAHAQSSSEHKLRVINMAGMPNASHSALPQADGGIVTLLTYPLTLAKLDSNFNPVWSTMLFGTHLPMDEGVGLNQQLLQPAAGGYFTAGTHIPYQTGNFQCVDFLRFRSNGDTQWLKSFRVAEMDITDAAEAHSIAQALTPGQGFIVGLAMGLDNIPDHKDPMLLCTDSSGNLLWAKQYAFPGRDEVVGIHPLQGGNCLIHIHNTMQGAGPNAFTTIIMKVDASGNQLWSKQIVASGNQRLKSFTGTMLGSNTLCLGGNISLNTPTTGPDDAFLFKIDTFGTVVWANVYKTGFLHNAFFTSAADQGSANLVLAGIYSDDTSTSASAVKENDVFVTNIHTSGSVSQAKGYPLQGQEYISTQEQDASGRWLFGGASNWNAPDSFSAYYLRPDINGDLGCNTDTTLSILAIPHQLIITAITPTTISLSPTPDTVLRWVLSATFEDSLICAGSTTSGVAQTAIVPAIDILIYPNPATDIVHFSGNEAVNIVIYSMEGRLLINQPASGKINVSVFPVGNYLLRLSNAKGELLQSSKLIIQR